MPFEITLHSLITVVRLVAIVLTHFFSAPAHIILYFVVVILLNKQGLYSRYSFYGFLCLPLTLLLLFVAGNPSVGLPSLDRLI